jgi:hypothetical protein
MSPKNILQGYKGIMSLDLNLIHVEHREQAIKQHLSDIKLYKHEQSLLSPRLRYENTIEHVNQQLLKEQNITSIKLTKLKQQQDERDQKYITGKQMYNNTHI